MPLFKLRVYNLHEQPCVIDDELWFIPKEIEWKIFHLYIDIDFVQIISFSSYALFNGTGEVEECTKVFLSDGSIVYAVNKVDSFLKNFEEVYQPLCVTHSVPK